MLTNLLQTHNLIFLNREAYGCIHEKPFFSIRKQTTNYDTIHQVKDKQIQFRLSKKKRKEDKQITSKEKLAYVFLLLY